MSNVTPTSSSTGTTMTPIATPNWRSANRPCRQLPDAAHTARGMSATMAAMTAAVFKKVITWR